MSGEMSFEEWMTAGKPTDVQVRATFDQMKSAGMPVASIVSGLYADSGETDSGENLYIFLGDRK